MILFIKALNFVPRHLYNSFTFFNLFFCKVNPTECHFCLLSQVVILVTDQLLDNSLCLIGIDKGTILTIVFGLTLQADTLQE